MSSSTKVAQMAASSARALLSASEEIPYFGAVAKLVNNLIAIIDQIKCNKKAGRALQVRFGRLADHLFGGSTGLATVAQSRPNDTSIATFCTRMEHILNQGNSELRKFVKSGFIISLLKGSKPQELFEGLDRDITECLNELSVALNLTQLTEQAQTYEVVCNIQAFVDQHGGLEGLMTDPLKMQRLAALIGADVDELGTEVHRAFSSLSDQINVVDENVRDIKCMMQSVQQAVGEIERRTVSMPADLSALQLVSSPAVNRARLLGVGAFGKVYKGTYNHMEVAVKELSFTGTITSAQLKELSREVLMHSKVGNLPGVTRLFGANLTLEPRCIVLELADGSLHDALHRKSLDVEFNLLLKLSLAAQLYFTIAAITDLGIIHRDIKSSNVLLFLNNRRVLAKLSDFGFTKAMNENSMSMDGTTTPKGTPPYMAPELFRGLYSNASDMYSFAVLLNELMTEQVPFPDYSYAQIVQCVGTFCQRPAPFKAEARDKVGTRLVQLIACGWNQDPALRLSFHDLGTELTHLLRKEVERTQLGDTAAPLTPPLLQPKIESAITDLFQWFTFKCNVDEPQAMALAHTLVTVKRITSPALLTQVLYRSPDYLTKEMHQSVVLEAQVCSFLSIHAKAPEVVLKPVSSVMLESLNTDQLCLLFDHCYISDLKAFVESNKLSGADLQGGVDSADDLIDLGLSKIKAKMLFNKICDWKVNGPPENFTVPLPLVENTPYTPYTPRFAQEPVSRTMSALPPVAPPVHVNSPVVNFEVSKLKLAADRGNADAQYQLGDCYYHGNDVRVDYVAAVYYYKLAADQGHAGAQNTLGICYKNGRGVSVDYVVAVKYYTLAADQGHAGAQNNLGICYRNGRGVTVDYVVAAKYYKLAADRGNVDAQYNLGNCHYKGEGVSVDYAVAVRYYKKAADKGQVNAQYSLGYCYYHEQGVSVDYVAAVKHFKLAAEKGHIAAQFTLGSCYYSGTGANVDYVVAARYFKMAADQGNEQAKAAYKNCLSQV